MSDGKIIIDTEIDNSGLEKGIKNFDGKLGSIASSAVKTFAKVSAGMATVASGAIAFLAKTSIENYAQYEQLVGGVETLFKNSSNKVIEYANNAYKSAGFSANEYMETITGFAASLLQGLGGDTEKAAEIGNMAVTDMSDNANKMGTAIERIQDAYQGFAKQNYTMLDNLKLGYGGTKTEMERLLADAEKISGIKYDISNFNDVIEAIHVIQEQMGITGTTSLEAATTIEGSLNMTKSAWKNLLTGMADSNADFDTLINNMVDSASAFGENILPRIQIAIEGIGKLIEKLLPPIVEKIPTILSEVLPSMIEAGANMIVKLIEGISNNLPQLLMAGKQIVGILAKAIAQSSSEIFNGIKEAINEFLPILNPVISTIELLVKNIDLIAGALVVATSAMVAFKAGSAIQDVIRAWQQAQVQLALYSMTCEGVTMAQGVANGVFSAWEVLVGLFTGKVTLAELATIAWSKAQALLNGVMSANPIGIVVALVAALVAGIIYLWNTNEGFRNAVIKAWNAIKETAVNVWGNICTFFTETIPKAFNTVIDFVKNNWQNLLLLLVNPFVGAFNLLYDNCEGFRNFINELVKKVLDAFKKWGTNITNFFSKLWSNILDTLHEWGNNVSNFFTKTIPRVIQSVIDWFNKLPYMIGYALGYVLSTIYKWGVATYNYFTTNVPIWISAVVKFFSELPGKIWTWLVESYNKISHWGRDTWNKAIEIGTNFLNSIIQFFSQLPGKIWTYLINTYNKVVSWGSNIYSKASEVGSNFINNIINWIKQLPGKFSSWLNDTISKVVSFASDLGQRASQAGQSMVNNIINAVKNLPSQMASIGKNIVEGVWNGITGMGSWLMDKVSSFFSGIVDGAKKALGIHSPSRVMRDQVGKYMAQGVGVGFENESDNVQKSMNRNLSDVVAKMQATVSMERLRAVPTGVTSINNTSHSNITNDNGVTQNITFNNPVKTPSEVARQIRKVGRELAFG